MGNRKKKKKQEPLHTLQRDAEVTKSYFDEFSVTARKTLRLIGLDPGLYDHFTKKQKIEMMRAKMIVPRIVVKPGHSVPRQYVKMIQKEMYEYLRSSYVGDPEIKLRYIDYVTMGSTFLMFMQVKGYSKTNCEQAETYKLITARAIQLDNVPDDDNLIMPYCHFLHILMNSITKLNFRFYGFEFIWKETDNMSKFAAHILLTSVKAEKIYFTYREKNRPAFRVGIGQFMTTKPMYVSIPYNKIIAESQQTYPLDIYIQSHALMRIKERLDVLNPLQRNIYLNSSLVYCRICELATGQLVIKFIKGENKTVGYLPFTIIDKKVFILSFLPICSQNAPEGKRLQELLGISRKEIEFLGMDKLSFFIDNDFEGIPRLKKAIVDAGLWHLTQLEPLPDYQPHNRVSATTLARFFQTERNWEEMLCEIEEYA